MNFAILLVDTDEIFNEIAKASATTADNTTLGLFDWFSISIAIVALLVASFSLYYAIATLRVSRATLLSQQKTESNTRRISFEMQTNMLAALNTQLFLFFAKWEAGLIYLDNHRDLCYPDRTFWGNMRLTSSYVQENSDIGENSDLYINLSLLREMIMTYNEELKSYSDIFSEERVDNDEIVDAFCSLFEKMRNISEHINSKMSVYYPELQVASLSRILSLKVDTLNKYALLVKKSMDINCVSVESASAMVYVRVLMNGKQFKEDENIDFGESEMYEHLVGVVSEQMLWMGSSFKKYDLDSGHKYVKTSMSVLLPCPSRKNSGKVNFGDVELYFVDNQLRLESIRPIEYPAIFFSKGNGWSLGVDFKEKKNTDTSVRDYYYADLSDGELKMLLTSPWFRIDYEPTSRQSCVDCINEREWNYSVMFGKYLIKWLYKNRIRITQGDSGALDLYANAEDKYYEIIRNDEGCVTLKVNESEGEPVSPQICLENFGYSLKVKFIRDKSFSFYLEDVPEEQLSVLMALDTVHKVRVEEMRGDSLVRSYEAKIAKSCLSH